jgi:hypothetical protein
MNACATDPVACVPVGRGTQVDFPALVKRMIVHDLQREANKDGIAHS